MKTFEELDEQTQNDLIEWYNASEPTSEDLELLVALFESGRFEAWNCECGEKVYRGDPEDWGHFQGVRQVDYTSYPGNIEKYQAEHLERMCDSCRCHCQPSSPPAGHRRMESTPPTSAR
jgi:hypothetical protein